VLAHLSIFDPTNAKDDDIHVRAGDELTIGLMGIVL
jgi:hypothetical protein